MVALMAAWIVTGSVSDNPHQHMIDGSLAKQVHYFDLEDGGQIVAYSKDKLERGVRLRLTGKEHAIEGQSKRPGDKRRMGETQLVVEKVEKLPSIDELIAKIEEKDAYKQLVDAKLVAVPKLIDALPNKRVEYALYDIVEPPYSEQQIAAMAPESDQKVSIDWKPWWQQNRHKSLRTIQTDLLPYYQRYWKSGGKTQKVPLEAEP